MGGWWGFGGRGVEAGHVNWNGIHTHMLVYINRYSVKTGGTVT